MNRVCFAVITLYAASHAVAFDYDPPPRVKTMEWTIKVASGIGTWVYEDATAESIIADLDRDMSLPGAYFDIDRSQVRDRLETKLTLHADKFTWLQMLASVADAVGANIIITPGKFTLVPHAK